MEKSAFNSFWNRSSFNKKGEDDKSIDWGGIAKGVGDTSLAVAKGTPGFLKSVFIDPGVQAAKDFYSSGEIASAGDWRGAGARFASGFGNAMMFGTGFLPALGWFGKGVGAGVGAAGAGLKAMRAASAGNKLISAGKAIDTAAHVPINFMKSTPAGWLTGARPILPYAPRGSFANSVGNGVRRTVNWGAPILSGPGLSIGGDYLYQETPSGRMDRVLASGQLPEFVGQQTADQITSMKDGRKKLQAFGLLEQMGVPDSIFSQQPQYSVQQ